MDFFHCNGCFIQPGLHTSKSFFFASCGHSFCEDCVNQSDCRVCRRSCKYLAINGDMPSEVRSYFMNSIKELKRVLKILLIQNKHCKIFMEEYVPKLEGKYLSAKLEIEKQRAEVETVKSTLQNKNTEIISLHKMIKKMQGEMEDMKKQFSRICQQNTSVSPGLLSPPNSFTSSRTPQYAGMFTPKSTMSSCSQHSRSSLNQYHTNKDSYLSSPVYNSNLQEKKRPTAMELLFRNKEPISRGSPLQNVLRTPKRNQSFGMTINTSPESSEDERWSPRSRISSSQTSLINPMTPNKPRRKFF